MMRTFQDFCVQLGRRLLPGQAPTPEQLRTIATELMALCQATEFSAELYPAAQTGQEHLFALAVDDPSGPSAYLVSDGVGVSSPPHEHQTWAIIVGLRGVERNIHFERLPGDGRHVVPLAFVDVIAGEFLCLAATDIHATDVVGVQASYAVHLYGRSLSALPAFAERCFDVQSGA